jgi:dipeptidyl aminopeptidase/acylaminoacyl peptidase
MFDDVTAVMNEVVKRPEVDVSRMGVLGGSYGGYATLWVIGHTHRFKAAIAERVVSDLYSEQLAYDFASASDRAYSFGNAWDNAQGYWNNSPLKYVQNVNTPLLLIHSDNDIRTPIDQALEEYSALKILGRTTTLVQFPRENHDLNRTGEPLHRVERLHIMADWFKKYLKP